MKLFMKQSLAIFIFIIIALGAQAQTADEVIAKYFSAMGGIDKYKTLKGVTISAKANQGGMDIPITITRLADGRQKTSILFQGKTINEQVYDGVTMWGTNFMTMKAEKNTEEETNNYKKDIGDFPSEFLDYSKRGWKLENLGKENVDGTDCFKLKLTKKPLTIDGKEVEDVSFHYFDIENNVKLMEEKEIKSGQGKGMIAQTKFSDYQEVGGIMFAFSIAQGAKGQPTGPPVTISKIDVNPVVADAEFVFPEDVAGDKKKGSDNSKSTDSKAEKKKGK